MRIKYAKAPFKSSNRKKKWSEKNYQKQPPEEFCKKRWSQRFRKFHKFQVNTCAGVSLLKRDSNKAAFLWNLCKSTYFEEHLRATASILFSMMKKLTFHITPLLFLRWKIINRNRHTKIQKQPSRNVLRKRCSENMQQIYRRKPMPKCDFDKDAKQLYWNCTSTWVSPVNLLHIFRTTFLKNTSGWLLLKIFSFFLQHFSAKYHGMSLWSITTIFHKEKRKRFLPKDLVLLKFLPLYRSYISQYTQIIFWVLIYNASSYEFVSYQ